MRHAALINCAALAIKLPLSKQFAFEQVNLKSAYGDISGTINDCE